MISRYKDLASFSLFVIFIIGFTSLGISQSGTITGIVHENERLSEFARVTIHPISKNILTDSKGEFQYHNIPFGSYEISVSNIGFKGVSETIVLSENTPDLMIKFVLTEEIMELDAVVITGTKTHKRQTNSNIIVNVLTSENLDMVQACNLSEGLRFQPGLRVETDCQTCNYTQLRMNGLAGGYSQILINGRPIFSPLTGLYGMEQLPTNMIG